MESGSYQTPVTQRVLVDALNDSSSVDSQSSYQSRSPAAIDPISHIRVVARIRPMSQDEAKRGGKRGVSMKEMDDTTEEAKSEHGLFSRLRCSFSSPLAAKDSLAKTPPRTNLEHLDEGMVLGMEGSSSSLLLQDIHHQGDLPDKQKNIVSLPTIITTESSTGVREFEMDAVFGPLSTQQFVYENSLPNMAEHLFTGYNFTVLAYGMTGSGKTFTMGGQKDARALAGDYLSASYSSVNAEENDGIIHRAVRDIFQLKHEYEDQQYSVRVQLSCLEIYQDELRDLLISGSTTASAMKLRDHGDGVTVRGLQTITTHTEDHVHTLMEQATLRRTTASTRLNERSSRSHAVCTISITVAPPTTTNKRDSVVTAKLTLVDLAGSERIKDTGVVGVQQQESININKDLFVLGKVVSALSERGKRGGTVGHVPYRDSKLTRLLRDSLGGNCRTVLIACVSPADINVEESINTLRYAERSRTISNVVKQNLIKADISPSEHAALRAENKKLRAMVSQLKTTLQGTDSGGFSSQLSGLQEKLRAAESEAKSARDLSTASAGQASRLREYVASANERQDAHNSFVSPLLSYELSVGIADDDLESLIDDSDSLWSFDDGMRLQDEIVCLTNEKTVLVNELADLTKQVAAQQSSLRLLRASIETQEQVLGTTLAVDAGNIQEHETGVEQAVRSDIDRETEVRDLRQQLGLCQAENNNLRQQNDDMQKELAQLREHSKRELLTYEISQIQQQINRIQSPVNVLQDSTDDTNKLELDAASPTRCMKKRVLSATFEEEKKTEDLSIEAENDNPMQPLLDELSASCSEPLYRDSEDDHYLVSAEHATLEIRGCVTAPSKASDAAAKAATSDIKAKAEAILNAAERIFDNSSHGSVGASAVSSVGTFFIPSGEREEPLELDGKVIISNIDVAGRCTCENTMFSGRADHVEFYLPKLGVVCNCGKGDTANSLEGDPLSLSNILRPWQCEFLASIDLDDAEEYIKAFKERGHEIAAAMRRWRRANGLVSVKTKSCVIALHIWSRTCRSVIRSVRDQEARGVIKPERPDFLQISINHDARSVSTMGFGSIVEAKQNL